MKTTVGRHKHSPILVTIVPSRDFFAVQAFGLTYAQLDSVIFINLPNINFKERIKK